MHRPLPDRSTAPPQERPTTTLESVRYRRIPRPGSSLAIDRKQSTSPASAGSPIHFRIRSPDVICIQVQRVYSFPSQRLRVSKLADCRRQGTREPPQRRSRLAPSVPLLARLPARSTLARRRRQPDPCRPGSSATNSKNSSAVATTSSPILSRSPQPFPATKRLPNIWPRRASITAATSEPTSSDAPSLRRQSLQSAHGRARLSEHLRPTLHSRQSHSKPGEGTRSCVHCK